MNNSVDIASLIDERDQFYYQKTTEIICRFSDKLTAAMQKHVKTDQNIYWNTIEVITELQDYVNLVGHYYPSIGETVQLSNGEYILIEESNRLSSKNIIKTCVPIKMLESGSIEELYKFIKELSTVAGLVTNEQLIEILRNAEFGTNHSLLRSENLEQFLDEATKPDEICGFNAKQLSSEQITKLSMYNSITEKDKSSGRLN